MPRRRPARRTGSALSAGASVTAASVGEPCIDDLGVLVLSSVVMVGNLDLIICLVGV